jgi:condensin complex subunit 2
LNNLTTDRSGRVVLDSNHYVKDEMEVSTETTPLPDESWRTLKQLYANGPSMEGLHVCESLPALKQLISDIDEVKLSDGRTTSPLDHIYDTNQDDRFNDYNDIEFNDDDENDEQNEDLENDSMDRFASAGVPDQELMEYFDNTMKRSATQLPVYWKVQRLKSTSPKVHMPQGKNKEEAHELINFHGSMEEDAAFENEIFSTSNAKIAIPVVHRNKGISCNNFCLTDEGNHTMQKLVLLFTKPLQSLRAFQKADVIEEPESDSESAHDYYYGDEPSRLLGEVTREDIDELNHSYIEDYSQPFPTQQANFAKQLNYEKISKRIDIGAIKEKMMGELKDEVKFSELTKNIPAYLNGSTGVYFICLLHLCNECSLDLQHTEDEDLLVNRIT